MQDKLFKSLSLGLIGGVLVFVGIKLMGKQPNVGFFMSALGGFALVDIINIWSKDKRDD